jgi:hypothetical protein
MEKERERGSKIETEEFCFSLSNLKVTEQNNEVYERGACGGGGGCFYKTRDMHEGPYKV